MKNTIKFKKLHPEAKLPVRAHDTDACFDCFATSIKDHGDGRVEYGLGFSIEMPEGGRVDCRPRSSIHKTGLILCNSVGTIDEPYRGELRAFFYNIIKELPNYEVGEKIIQIKFEFVNDIEFVEVDELSDTERGSGGFGSTGK